MWQLLFEFRDSFALSEEEVGETHLVQHEIDTGDARPIKMHPRRVPLARQGAADKAVLEIQRADFIEPSDSPRATPVVMVPSKGGKLRFCADYRWLNEVTRKDSYPISNQMLLVTWAEYNRCRPYSEMLTYKPLTNSAVSKNTDKNKR